MLILNETMKLLYLVLGGLTFTLGFDIFQKSKHTGLATSSWGKKASLQKLLGNDGLIISHNIQLSEKYSNEGVCVIAPTGEGKTSNNFFPNLLSNNLEGSIVISDQKGELYEKTANYQKSIGRKPILFSPLGYGSKYNILSECKNTTEVKLLAENLLMNGSLSVTLQTGGKQSGAEWITMATPLLSSALLYAYYKGYPCNNIPYALKLLLTMPLESLDLLFLSNDTDEEIKQQWSIFLQGIESSVTTGSIKITMSSNMKLFTDKNLIKNICNTDFTTEDLRKEKIALYVNYDFCDTNYLSPFLSVFYGQLFSHLLKTKGHNVYFMFDELGNLGMIPNLPSNVSVCRSANISILACLQSVSQLKNIYGQYNTQTILNNLKTKVILPSLTDLETLKLISEWCGEEEVYSKSHGNNVVISTAKKPLATPDEIRRINDESLIIIAHNKKVIKDEQELYWKHDKYLKNIG